MSVEELDKVLRHRDGLDTKENKLRSKLAQKRGASDSAQLSGLETRKLADEIRMLETELREVSKAAATARISAEQFTQKQAKLDEIARLNDLRRREEQAFQTTVSSLVELEKAIENLSELHRILAMYGASPSKGLSSNLMRALLSELDYLRFVQPELFGQHPGTAQTEAAIQEIECEIDRLKELISVRMQVDKKHVYPQLLAEYERELELARARLEFLVKGHQNK